MLTILVKNNLVGEMMRKGIIFYILIVLLNLIVNMKGLTTTDESIMKKIPDEAIRLRILANSDSGHDQYIKNLVRDEVNLYITDLVQHIDDIEVGRQTIQKSIPEIKKIAERTLESNGIDQTVHVEYGENISFPLKVYDNYVYPAGEYEAILITIGEGKGANWWCVLFPPLCFLDFSNGTVVSETGEDVEEDIEEDIDEENQEEEGKESEEDEEDNKENEEESDFVVKFFLFEWLGLS